MRFAILNNTDSEKCLWLLPANWNLNQAQIDDNVSIVKSGEWCSWRNWVNLLSGVYQYFILVSSNLVNSNHIHLDFSLFPPSRKYLAIPPKSYSSSFCGCGHYIKTVFFIQLFLNLLWNKLLSIKFCWNERN